MRKNLLLVLMLGVCVTARAQTGTFSEGSLQVGDSLRTYLLYVPAAYDGSESWPLILLYHGYSIDGAFQKDIDLMALAADRHNSLLVYPNGLIVNDPWDGPGTGWNFDGLISPNDDVRFTRELIDHLSENYAIDPERVHATGYSMGSQMLWGLVCQLSDKVASIAGVSGPIDDAYRSECDVPRPFSAMLIHGTGDIFWPPEGVEINGYSFGNPQETIEFMAQHNRCTAEPVVSDLADLVAEDSSTVKLYEYADCDSGTEVKYYNVLNGGHTWPGGSFPGGEWPGFLGHVNRDIDASNLILDFFDRNPMPPKGDWIDGSLMSGDSLRTYSLYVPPAYDGSEPWPLVVVFHGYGIDGKFQNAVDRFDRAADKAGYLIVYPNGLIVDDPLFPPERGPGFNYNGLLSSNNDVEFTRALIGQLQGTYAIDANRIHASGLSLGTSMMWAAACELDDLLASVGGVAGTVDEAYFATCRPEHNMSALLVYGTLDPFVPPGGLEVNDYTILGHDTMVRHWAELIGCTSEPSVQELDDIVVEDSTSATLINYAGCPEGREVRFYRINEGGHTWPRGEFPGGVWPQDLGFVNWDLDASAVILDFFSQNPTVATFDETESKLATTHFSLYPNPFARQLTVDLALSAPGEVVVTLYNVLGQKVVDLEHRQLPAGMHKVSWNGGVIPAGLYFVQVIANGDRLATKPVVHLGY